MVVTINLEIDWYKPKHAKNHWVVQFKNHTKFNRYWNSDKCKLHKNISSKIAKLKKI